MNAQRLIAAGTLTLMPRRQYPREGPAKLLVLILLFAIAWALVI
jgi:hypothetical protein